MHARRRRRADAIAGVEAAEGWIAFAFKRVARAKVPSLRLREFFESASVAAVLTAHPTEVQRKSILDTELEIARLIGEMTAAPLPPEKQAQHAESLRAKVLTLWQTGMLRSLCLSRPAQSSAGRAAAAPSCRQYR